MKISLQFLFLGAAAATDARFVPARISFDDLVRGGSSSNGGDDVFWKALGEVGLLSITDIPGFNKQSMLKDLEECLHNGKVGAPEFHLDHPGHRRRTLATSTLAGTPEDILVATARENNNSNGDDSSLCSHLKDSSQQFRAAVQRTSEAIAARFGAAPSAALQEIGDFGSRIPIARLINEGEHLEHFHSFYASNRAANSTAHSEKTTTIDWHTDQGMMLLFTPGQQIDGRVPSVFSIQLGDGSTAEVDFDSRIDDLVVMLGDGVNQYINNVAGNHKSVPLLRAVPHSVSLSPSHDAPRLWYGRMVLPPPLALHPHDGTTTFRELRTAMIRGDADARSLGCASESVFARELSEEMDLEMDDEFHNSKKGCDESTSQLCWMQCMNYTEEINTESCASQSENHALVCANADGVLWQDGIHSSAYSLRCLSQEASSAFAAGARGLSVALVGFLGVAMVLVV